MPSPNKVQEDGGLFLPFDVWSGVLKHLSQTDRMKLRLVCKGFSMCKWDTASLMNAVIRSQAAARSLELFLANRTFPHLAPLKVTLAYSWPQALLHSTAWVCPFLNTVSCYHLQSLDISHPLNIKTAVSILLAAPNTLISLAMHVPAMLLAAHAWQRVGGLQRLAMDLIPERRACDPVGVMQLSSLTSLSFRGPGCELVRAKGFGFHQLRLLTMEQNVFLGNLDLAKFPRLAEMHIGHAAEGLNWLLRYPIPKLKFTGGWPCGLVRKGRELHCSELCIVLDPEPSAHLDKFCWSVKAERLLQMPQLRLIRLSTLPCSGSHRMCRVTLYGSWAAHRKLLQRVKIEASASIRLRYKNDGDDKVGRWKTMPLMANGHSPVCLCSSCEPH